MIERDKFLEEIQRDPEAREEIRREADTIAHPISRLFPSREANASNDALTHEYCRRVADQIRSSNRDVIIVDGTHLQPLSRAFIRDSKDVKKIAIVFPPDPETSIARLHEEPPTNGIRKTVTPGLIRRMAEYYETPSMIEGFNDIQIVSEKPVEAGFLPSQE